MLRTTSEPDTDAGATEAAGGLWGGLLTAVRHCCALVVTVLLSPRLWWRRRRPGTRTVIGTAAMILASSTVSLLLGLSTATASTPRWRPGWWPPAGSAALQQTLTRLLARITGTRGCCG